MIQSDEIDWEADAWFAGNYHHELSDEFKRWWISYYGKPTDYADNYDEQHEYWMRCAFALSGWVAKSKLELLE